MSAADQSDLLAQIRSAQADLDQLIAQLGNDAGTVLADGQSQRQLLASLERSLTTGSVSAGPIRNEVAAAVASAGNFGQHVRMANDQRGNVDLATAQARTRATVLEIGRDIFERRIFDPYLRFASLEEEAAYRRREEENRRAIADALAENTPEGDLRAARIVNRQLQDAGAHGADASPEYQGILARSRQGVDQLSQAIGEPQAQAGAERTEQDTQLAEPATPASDQQLASVLATFRAAGIGGGLQASDSGHGLHVNAGPRDQGRSTPA